MKPAEMDSGMLSGLPAPVIANNVIASPPSYLEDVEMLRYLFPDDPETASNINDAYSEALNIIFELSPEAKEKIIALMELGDEGGSHSALKFFKDSLDTIVYNIQQRNELTERMDDMSGHTATFGEALVRSWAIGSVKAEIGNSFPFSDSQLASKINQGHISLHGINHKSESAYADDRGYWRAMVAVCMTNPYLFWDQPSYHKMQDIRDFLAWASTKDHLGDIIRVGAERDTRNVEHIRSILEMNAHDGSTALSSGTL
jgi:hypothetical protein